MQTKTFLEFDEVLELLTDTLRKNYSCKELKDIFNHYAANFIGNTIEYQRSLGFHLGIIT